MTVAGAARAMRRARDEERGGVLVLVCLGIVVFIGIAALVVDVGNARLHQRRLQSAVDLGLLAGAQKLPDTTAAKADAVRIAQENWDQNASAPVTFTASTGCRNPGCPQPDKITLEADSDIPTYLSKLFGVDKWGVDAHGSACGPCEITTQKFDVMVILDRSYSMCLDSSGAAYPNPGGTAGENCKDLDYAKAGVRSMLTFFDPGYDRVGLAAISSGDSVEPFDHTGPEFPCDGARTSESNTFSASWGDFMDGTAASHDSWVLAPLASNFKNADGSINNSSPLVSTVNCLRHKYWTPVAPAIEAAKDELISNSRPGARQFIVLLGDGGANVQPMERTAAGAARTPNPPGVQSWYTPTGTGNPPANNLRPCPDAIAQAQAAKSAGIEVFTIGYDLNASGANACRRNNNTNDTDPGYTSTSTLSAIASPNAKPGEKHFFPTQPGNVNDIFSSIARQITGGGTRLID